MSAISFKVTIPDINNNNSKDFFFDNRQQVCDFLKISQMTFYSILNNKLKCKRIDKLHLNGITIQKITNENGVIIPLPGNVVISRSDYLNSILNT